MAKKLTRLVVDEISLVDRGAGEGVRVMLAKRRDRMSDNERRYAAVFRQVDFAKAMISQPTRVPDEDIDNGDDVTDGKLSPQLEQMISAMIVALPTLSRQQAAHWLLNTASGRSLAQHLSSTTKGDTTMDLMTGMMEIAKAEGGMVAIAKNIIDKGETKLNEAQFTQLLTEHARLHKLANESDGSAFSRIFSAQTPEGLEIRKAHAITKNTAAPLMAFEPTQVGGDDVNVNDSAKAYQQLVDMAEAMRAKSPDKTIAQCFAAIFVDTKNAELAARAHRRPNASDAGAYPFPT